MKQEQKKQMISEAILEWRESELSEYQTFSDKINRHIETAMLYCEATYWAEKGERRKRAMEKKERGMESDAYSNILHLDSMVTIAYNKNNKKRNSSIRSKIDNKLESLGDAREYAKKLDEHISKLGAKKQEKARKDIDIFLNKRMKKQISKITRENKHSLKLIEQLKKLSADDMERSKMNLIALSIDAAISSNMELGELKTSVDKIKDYQKKNRTMKNFSLENFTEMMFASAARNKKLGKERMSNYKEKGKDFVKDISEAEYSHSFLEYNIIILIELLFLLQQALEYRFEKDGGTTKFNELPKTLNARQRNGGIDLLYMNEDGKQFHFQDETKLALLKSFARLHFSVNLPYLTFPAKKNEGNQNQSFSKTSRLLQNLVEGIDEIVTEEQRLPELENICYDSREYAILYMSYSSNELDSLKFANDSNSARNDFKHLNLPTKMKQFNIGHLESEKQRVTRIQNGFKFRIGNWDKTGRGDDFLFSAEVAGYKKNKLFRDMIYQYWDKIFSKEEMEKWTKVEDFILVQTKEMPKKYRFLVHNENEDLFQTLEDIFNKWKHKDKNRILLKKE